MIISMDSRAISSPSSNDQQDMQAMEADSVPFPRTRSDGDLDDHNFDPLTSSAGRIPRLSHFELADSSVNSQFNQSPTSQMTSSSKQTSSDKLSALPTSQSTPNPYRNIRSPNLSSSSNHTRGYHRSLDASTSLPSFATADFDPPRNAIHNLNSHLSAGGPFSRAVASAEGSLERAETPKQRVSFDSDRGSSPAKHSIRQVISRLSKGSDPVVASPLLRSSAYADHRDSQKEIDSSGNLGSRSRSHSRSRAASPLRILQQWSAGLHRHGHRTIPEEPFVCIDPFKRKPHIGLRRRQHTHTHPSDVELGSLQASVVSHARCPACVSMSSVRLFLNNLQNFMTDTFPRQVYLHLLLRLPAMYFTRVARIFEDAEVSRPDIQRMIDTRGGGGAYMIPSASENVHANAGMAGSNYGREPGVPLSSSTAAAAHTGLAAAAATPYPLPFPDDWSPPVVSPALIRFKHSWEVFIDSLLREWKTLNLVSALLLSSIVTMFQIPDAEGDPLTRTAALLSLICSLMSLSYGCMFIVRFGTMRSMYRASRWAEEARKTNTVIWWNVWVLLAMPAVWMAWSMLLFVVCILSFVWRTGSVADTQQPVRLSPGGALVARIAITAVFALGMFFMAMIVRTLKRYGAHEERPSSSMGKMPGSHQSETRKDLRARDIDAAMERRGRERERSVSGRGRREETPEASRRKVMDGDVVGREKGGLKSVLGLGLKGLGMKDLDSGIEVDLEKSTEDEKIAGV